MYYIIITLAAMLFMIEPSYAQETAAVAPVVETYMEGEVGDVDDPCVWVHPQDASLSLIVSTDKDQGLHVFDLSGRQVQFLPDGYMNNIDIRYGFPWMEGQISLLATANRQNNTLAFYTIDESSLQLVRLPCDDEIELNVIPYGSCLYKSPRTGKFYCFVNSKGGFVEQWELQSTAEGMVTGERVRTLAVGTQTEGCVADDELGFFYIGEENVGIWKYGAEPDDGAERRQVDHTGVGGHLTADVEGITIYYAGGGQGYLIASSQGNNTYAIYKRESDNAFVGSFRITAANGIDGTEDTDGIDVINLALGELFPHGLFLAHDGEDSPSGKTNLKLVPWDSIARSFNPPLLIDTEYRVQ